MITNKFLPSKLEQWSKYNYKENIIWSTGLDIDVVKNHTKALLNAIAINKSPHKIIKEFDTHFALIIINKKFLIAIVDCARTYPIFWTKHKDYYLFSPQADEINNITHYNINKSQLLAFQMSGYTTYNNTLWNNIKSLDAGSFLFLNSNNKIKTEKYFEYNPWKFNSNKNINYKFQLKIEFNKLLKKLINEANGRTICIPLSAGLDSRLIASGLKHLGHTNVKCFAYGKKNNYEAIASRKIAKKLNYQWKFCKINHFKMKLFFKTELYKSYVNKSNDGVSTQGMQDIYVIDQLLKNNFIGENDIIVNGNSGDFISGGHIPKTINNNLNIYKFKTNSLSYDLKNILDMHIKKHYSLWGSLMSKKNIYILIDLFLQQLQQLNIKSNQAIYLHGILEYLEFHNRQNKYVINLQRTYEFFKITWRLPLWNKDFIDFWSDVPLDLKLNQKLYKETLKELNYGNVWTEEYDFPYRITPKWIIPIRYLFKIFYIFSKKEKWHKFDKHFLNYWTDNVCGYSMFPYLEIIKNKHNARNSVSWRTLQYEEINLGNNWQKSKKE